MCGPRLIISWFLETLSTCEGGEAIEGTEHAGEAVPEDENKECKYSL